MSFDLSQHLVIGVSSRALFHLEDEARIYKKLGLAAYQTVQIGEENEPLAPGTAFPLVKRLLSITGGGQKRVEVIIISHNHPDTSLRIFNAIKSHKLDITRAAFVGSDPLTPYLNAFGVDLFLSGDHDDVQCAIDAGICAATVFPPPDEPETGVDTLRIAFDGDAVLFSEESETIFKTQGLEAFVAHETANAQKQLAEGPFAKFLMKLGALQTTLGPSSNPFKLAVVTARNSPAHERVVRTLREWGVKIDAAFFLGGITKSHILRAFGAHIFFDDQEAHLFPAARTTPCAVVPYKTDSPLRRVIPTSE